MLQTERLILRRWKDSDREPFAAMNANPRVMEFFPDVLTREESDQFIDRAESDIERYGFGLFAAELKETGAFIGFIGLHTATFQAHFTPCVEIGWRIDEPYWHKGLATEGSRAVVDYAFKRLRLDSLVSFTAPDNLTSRRLMERLGMVHDSAG